MNSLGMNRPGMSGPRATVSCVLMQKEFQFFAYCPGIQGNKKRKQFAIQSIKFVKLFQVVNAIVGDISGPVAASKLESFLLDVLCTLECGACESILFVVSGYDPAQMNCVRM